MDSRVHILSMAQCWAHAVSVDGLKKRRANASLILQYLVSQSVRSLPFKLPNTHHRCSPNPSTPQLFHPFTLINHLHIAVNIPIFRFKAVDIGVLLDGFAIKGAVPKLFKGLVRFKDDTSK